MIKTVKSIEVEFSNEYVFIYNDYIGASILKKNICQGHMEYVELPPECVETLYGLACCADEQLILRDCQELDYVDYREDKFYIDTDAGTMHLSRKMTRNLLRCVV